MSNLIVTPEQYQIGYKTKHQGSVILREYKLIKKLDDGNYLVEEPELKTYYFTFGFGQPHQDRYHIIRAYDYHKAREKMFERFGERWAGQYNDDEWVLPNGKTQAQEYNLRKLS